MCAVHVGYADYAKIKNVHYWAFINEYEINQQIFIQQFHTGIYFVIKQQQKLTYFTAKATEQQQISRLAAKNQ